MQTTLHLRGGLGNQLFQLIAGVHFASRFGSSLVLDDSAIISHRDKSRGPWLRKITVDELFPRMSIRWQKEIISYLKSSRLGNSFRNQESFDEEKLKTLKSYPKNLHIYDWFQSISYLPSKKLRLHLENLIDIRSFASEAVQEKRNNMKAAAIHVRLGDFRFTKWGVLAPEWYKKAVNTLTNEGVTEIDCYSDNILEARLILEECSNKIRFNYPEESAKLLPHELLLVMAQYRYFISSNSTLSWWASYFNQREDAQILCAWDERLFVPNWRKI